MKEVSNSDDLNTKEEARQLRGEGKRRGRKKETRLDPSEWSSVVPNGLSDLVEFVD